MATIRVYHGAKGTRYSAQIRFKNHSESQTFRTKADAKRWAQQHETELREKPHLAGTEAHKRTVTEAIDRYLNDYLPKKGKSLQANQPRQLAWWKEHYGDLPLSHFNAPHK